MTTIRRRKVPVFGDHVLEGANGGARIGQGEGWGDWFRRQVPFGDWRTEEQKLSDFKAWDDWNRANGLPGAFGEPARLQPEDTFLNPRELTPDNPWGVTPEALKGLQDLRDGPPDGSRHPLPGWAREELDLFVKEAEQNQDILDVDSLGRPGYDPDAGLPRQKNAEAPLEESVAVAQYDATEESGNGDATVQNASDEYGGESFDGESYGGESIDV